MKILLGHDESVAEWVGRVNGKAFHHPYTAIGIIDEQGTLTGGYVFTGYNGDGVELSLAGRGVVNRDGWRAVVAYVFGQLGCVRLQMHTSIRNKIVCRNLARLFPRRSYEGISRRFYGREDAVCYALTTDDLDAFRSKWRL